MTRPLRPILKQLRQAAEAIDPGGPAVWVRQCRARAIIGCNECSFRHRENAGELATRRLAVPPTWTEARGVRVYYALDDLTRFAERWVQRRAYRMYTGAERTAVRQRVGLEPIEDTAAAIGRKVRSVHLIVRQEGGLWTILREEHGLIRVHEFARLVRRDRANVKDWIYAGMPVRRRPGRQRQYLIHLPSARAWLMQRDNILLHMHPDVRRLLRLTPADLERAAQGAAA